MISARRGLALSALLLLVLAGCLPLEVPAQDGSCRPADPPSRHTLFGPPAGTPASNTLVGRELYALSANHATKFADWVAYVLDGSTFGESRDVDWDNDDCLAPDQRLEADGPSGDDMIGASAAHGYERGHMAPNATFAGAEGWERINLYANMTPQHRTLNGGAWAELEAAVREFVSQGNEVYVLTGTLYEEAMPILPNADEAHVVPSDYWKIVATGSADQPEQVEATAFLFDQHGCVVEAECRFAEDLTANIVPIDEIERRSAADGVPTDLDVFPEMPEAIETELESAPGAWPLRAGPDPGGSEAAADVKITKVLADPDGEEPANEWIEVCNQASEPAEIAGWTISDGEGSYRFPAGTELARVATVGSCVRVPGSTYNPTGDTNGLMLANGGETLVLRDAEGTEVHRCAYGDAEEGEAIVCVA